MADTPDYEEMSQEVYDALTGMGLDPVVVVVFTNEPHQARHLVAPDVPIQSDERSDPPSKDIYAGVYGQCWQDRPNRYCCYINGRTYCWPKQ